MMENMWNIQLEQVDASSTPPNEIVEFQCNYLYKAAQGRVMAKMADYTGPVSSYTRPGFGDVMNVIGKTMKSIPVDIQEDLGDIGRLPNRFFTFEFFLTSSHTPNYKYRIMFFRYEIDYYPLTIVLDDEIANDMGVEQRLTCENEDVFKAVLAKIINSAKVEKVIQNLYNLSRKAEHMKTVAVSEDDGSA